MKIHEQRSARICLRHWTRALRANVASEIHDLLIKTHAADRGKIEEIKALVWEYLFIDRILEVATEAVPKTSATTA